MKSVNKYLKTITILSAHNSNYKVINFTIKAFNENRALKSLQWSTGELVGQGNCSMDMGDHGAIYSLFHS